MAQSQDEKDVQSIKDPKARKEAYYTQQRRKAQATGSPDAAKISKKLGWGGVARGMAKDTVNSAMSRGPLSMPGGEAAEAVEGAGKALGGVARKALGSAGRDLLKRGEGAVEGAYQRLRTPTPVKKALGSSKPALGAKSQSRSLSPAEKRSAKAESNNSPKSMQGNQRKALSTSGQWHYEKELGKQAGRKLPKEPKTFNRNGTKRAEGRQKSDRNPVSTRAKAPAKKSTAKSKHMDEWSQ